MGFFLPADAVFDAATNASSPDHQSFEHMRTTLARPPAYRVSSTRPFVLCSAPKTGCTGWMHLLLLIATGINWPSLQAAQKNSNLSIHFEVPRMHRTLVWQNQMEHIAGLDRIIITRNPFVRFMSSYFDWQTRNKRNATAAKASFAEFTSMYEKRKRHRHQHYAAGEGVLLNHIDPVSRTCAHADLRYNLVLRVEEQSLWFDTIVARYDLRAYLDELHAYGFDLYVPLVDGSTPLRSTVAEVVGAKAWNGKRYNSSHHMDALPRLHQLYTPELARRVFALQRPDFELFGYPAWDGHAHTFRLI